MGVDRLTIVGYRVFELLSFTIIIISSSKFMNYWWRIILVCKPGKALEIQKIFINIYIDVALC